jgi:hypothetical protein
MTSVPVLPGSVWNNWCSQSDSFKNGFFKRALKTKLLQNGIVVTSFLQYRLPDSATKSKQFKEQDSGHQNKT